MTALFGLLGLAMASGVGILAAAMMHVDSDRPAALVVEATVHDFGTVPSGQPLEYSFAVRNTGDRRLVLQEISSSCSCGAGSKKPLFIEPRGTGAIPVRLETAKIRGPFKIEVRYHSSDPERPILTFSLLADVTTP